MGHVRLEEFKKTVKGKPRLGVEIFSNALLITPKTLLANSGHDVQDKILGVVSERESKAVPVGVSLVTGDAIDPTVEGIWDNFLVKKQIIGLGPVLAEQLLLVDEVIR